MSNARTAVIATAAIAWCAALLPTVASAQQGPMRPGLWEFSMSGMPMQQTVCITPEMARDVTHMGRREQGSQTDCKSSTPQVSGNVTTFTVSCTKPDRMTSKMTLTRIGADKVSMTQEYDMTMRGQRRKGTTTMNYTRLGECAK